MLKGEVVTQFIAGQFGSTASSVSSAGGCGWQRPATPALSSTRRRRVSAFRRRRR
jgi:hypothetical protein